MANQNRNPDQDQRKQGSKARDDGRNPSGLTRGGPAQDQQRNQSQSKRGQSADKPSTQHPERDR